jgi:hypothetical protein
MDKDFTMRDLKQKCKKDAKRGQFFSICRTPPSEQICNHWNYYGVPSPELTNHFN